jgi:hypothetical protein
MERLLKILSYKRGHGSVGEQEFTDEVLAPYIPECVLDDQGEVIVYLVRVKGKDGNIPLVLFSSHIDTVHDRHGEPLGRKVAYDWNFRTIQNWDKTPLGADDGAGVWLMLEMIDAGIPGVYSFTRGEERGGIGSSAWARLHPGYLEKFKFAIAFDRRGRTSVVTHQVGVRCCSDTFARALADQLNQGGLHLAPDSTGVYTDTAEYTHLIPECTNISVGYESEHTMHETLYVEFLYQLRDAIVTYFDPNPFPVVRDPRVVAFSVHHKLNTHDILDMTAPELVNWVEGVHAEDVVEVLKHLAEGRLSQTAFSYDEESHAKR